MDVVERAVRDAAILGIVFLGLAFLQGLYNLVEAIRHLILDGWTDHTQDHLRAAWPLIFFICVPHFIKAAYLVYQRRKTRRGN